MAEQQAAINIPQLLVLLVLGFLIFRWYYSTPAAPTQARGARVNPAQLEQVMSMFPQLDRRTVMWALQSNGGSVPHITEVVLSGRGLATPPPSFQPRLPPPPSAVPASPRPKPTHPDLITRYNLASKLNSQESTPATSDSDAGSGKGKAKQAWSNNKNERSALLQKRREEMILAARRKMEEKEREKAGS